jgi:monooxygenase
VGRVSAARADVDVLIVGAGLSGVGAACHLERERPGRSYAILEARESIGGTWDLFRYPGVRSDSDMFTLGYAFRPWDASKRLADGPSILDYVRQTAREHGIEERIRFGHRVLSADWSSAQRRWTVEAERVATGERVRMTCRFLFGCTGYYRYDRGYTPRFEGMGRFRGEVVHPQHWPAGLDYEGKRVVVIGSGATAVTLVPAMSARAAHVTLLQRSPSYVMSVPARDPLAEALMRRLPPMLGSSLVRWKNVLLTMGLYKLSRGAPQLMRALLARWAAKRLPAGFDVGTHFNPRYDPWDQRMCFVPDGDLFAALGAGSASIVTDEIETFTERGLRLRSGGELEADIVVTATGLELLPFGGIALSLDGQPTPIAETVAYKGMMLSGIPNFAFAVGYTNASWTLKCDLASGYVCRLLAHMDAHGYEVCVPDAPDRSLARRPLLDLQAGYVLRSLERFPKQSERPPWRLHQNYIRDVRMLRWGPLDDAISFHRAPAGPRRAPVSQDAGDDAGTGDRVGAGMVRALASRATATAR